MKISASDLCKQLLDKEKILNSEGKILFTLNGLSTLVNDKNIIGNVLQDWLAEWMIKNEIEFVKPPNSQEFPDFYLDPSNPEANLLEIKAFDINAGANFDIANFEAYCSSLITKRYRLDANYLIFGYELIDGKLIIKNLWLKKIWEISGPSEAYPVRVQQKRGMIYNLRPINWFSEGRITYKGFGSKEEFLTALHKTLLMYVKTSEQSIEWLKQVSEKV